MGGVELLAEARAAGVSVTANGDRLVVRGPKTELPIAERLAVAKSAVLAALADEAALPDPQTEVWWDDCNPQYHGAPILQLPPRACLAPRLCSRIGVCERHE